MIKELLKKLREQNIKLSLNGNNLNIDAPKGKLSQEIVKKIKENKQSIINYLYKHSKNETQQIKKTAQKDYYDLTSTQKGFWILDKKNTSEYNNNFVTLTYRIKGKLNIERLNKAFQEIINRHEVFRTVFMEIDGIPKQKIINKFEYNINLVDISNKQNQESEIQSIVDEHAKIKNNLSTLPLFKFTIIKKSSGESVLLFFVEHIIFDGTSITNFFNELALAYGISNESSIHSLPEIRFQYRDYSDWHNSYLQSDKGKADKEYWLETFKEKPSLPDIPADFQRRAVQSLNGDSLKFNFEADLYKKITEICKQHNTTLFNFLTAALKILIFKYTKQNDLVFGTVSASRQPQEIEENIGCYIKNLAIRSNIDSEKSFTSYLKQINDTTLTAFEHQQYSLDLLLSELKINKDTSRHPLIDVFLVLQNYESNINRFNGLDICEIYTKSNTVYFDLLFEFIQHGVNAANGLDVIVRYNSDLYLPSTITRFIQQLTCIMECICEQPSVQIKDIEFIPVAEKQKILKEFNNTSAEYPQNTTIDQYFDKQVNETPKAIAVADANTSLTYIELKKKSEELAARLQYNGVGKGDCVALITGQTVEMIIGILGILKAGAAYLPIDMEFPKERIDYILSNSSAKAIITVSDIKYSKNIQTINVNYPGEKDISFRASKHTSQDNAYIIYTSGTTGQPKGVVIKHRSVMNFVNYNRKVFCRFNKKLQVALLANYVFDASVQQIFSSLLYGHTLHLISKELKLNPPKLHKYFNENRIDIFDTTPSLFANLVLPINDFSEYAFKIIIVGGEALPVKYVSDFYKKKLPQGVRLLNAYGPTETTVDASYFEMKELPQFLKKKDIVYIGKPNENTRIYILDKEKNIVPIGVPGEMYISGACLSTGYLNNKALTAEKFIANPFEPGELMYSTGDLCRWTDEGYIDYIGRTDNQVKIRGYRIELGEIEALINQNDSIKENAVLAKDDNFNNKQLVAFIVSEKKINIVKLKEELLEKIPEYMVPSHFVQVEHIPLTPGGKLDKKALPEPDLTKENGLKFVKPKTSIEIKLANIWSQVLKIERIGIQDNFFELGGHSLLAAQVISKVHVEFNTDIQFISIFEKPTISSLAKLIEQNSFEKPYVQIQSYKKTGTIPLSYAQERMWFLEQYQQNNSTYNVPGVIRLKGSLNIKALENAFKQLINRHEVLRTNFVTVNDKPQQNIHEQSRWELQVTDLSNLSEGKANKEVKRRVNKEFLKPFNLQHDSLLRTSIYKVSKTNHVLFINMHHAVSDAWSYTVLLKEISEIYTANINNSKPDLPELKIQYADYAIWQREYFNGSILEEQTIYWKKKLKDVAVLELPSDYQRPAEQTYNGSTIKVNIDKHITVELNRLAGENSTTLYMVLLSAFKILLYKYTGQEDICVGSPVANRTRSELEPLLGVFINTLALRSNVCSNIQFTRFLNQVKTTTLEAYKYQELPFEKVVDAVQPERNLAYPPLYQVLFSLENTPGKQFQLPGIKAEMEDVDTTTSKFDLTFSLQENIDGIHGMMNYNTDIFKKKTIEGFYKCYINLLKSILGNPNQLISELEILDKREQKLILNKWNSTIHELPENKTFHKLFEEQVEKTPDNIALIFNEQEITYRTLNTKAKQVAEYLLESNIKPDDLVAISMERSIEMITGILGVLKSGAAYVPIDPELPQSRIDFILEDTKSRFVITSKNIYERFKALKYNWVALDINTVLEQKNSKEYNKQSKAISNNLAYVIYTSGSTGMPKGVMVEHRNIVNLVYAQKEEFNISENERILQFASINFDASIEQIGLALFSGAALVLIDKETIVNENKFENYISQKQVTHLHAVPLFLNGIKLSKPNKLKRVVSGGDVCPVGLAERFYNQFDFYNKYGPTETTVTSIQYKVENLESGISSLPIGKPIVNTQVYVLDKDLHPVPTGVKGELYIGGAGVARGYLNRPELTQERFINHPFQQGAILYKTGDIVKYLPDGNIEFIGRIDNQVKIRGHRIELGEIEAILNKLKLVKESTVQVYEKNTDKQLIAYVVFENNVVANQELREKLRTQLPDYMIPVQFISLSELPLNNSGKLDKKALPGPDFTFESSKEFKLPETKNQKKIAEIWKQVLNLEKVSVNDNFFELGGHSLLATQVISKIHKKCNVEIRLKTIFEKPTIRELALEIDNTKEESQYVQIQSYSRRRKIPLSFAQERMWFLDQYQQNDSSYNVASVYKLKGNINVKVLEDAFNEIILRHEVLRTNFKTVNDVPQQKIKDSSDWKLQSSDYSHLAISEARECVLKLIENEVKKSFNLGADTLLRTHLYKTGKQEYIMLINMHHAISDAWSHAVFSKELSEIYMSFSNAEKHKLPEPGIQYADYAIWQRDYFKGEVLKKHTSYWKKKLAGVSVLDFPLDFKRPAEQTFNGKAYPVIIEKELVCNINKIAQENEVTLFMVLLAGFKTLLLRYTGQNDICVGSPIANRTRTEIEPLIGTFINTLALRSNIDNDATFLEILQQIKATTLEAYQYQDLPFEKVVDAVQPERNLAYSPLFQVMFSLENTPQNTIKLFDLQLEPLEIDTKTTKFDIVLTLREEETGIRGTFDYNTDLFKEETIERLTKNFYQLLNSIADNPNQPVSKINILSDEEKKKLLIDWNKTALDYPQGHTFHKLFEKQVQQTPYNVALIFNDKNLTYQQLNEKANRLACYLNRTKLQPDDLVAISLERSVEMIVAVLATLKVGAAYVPVDPELPKSRVNFILSDTKAKLLITSSSVLSRHSFTAMKDSMVVDVDPVISGARKQIQDLDNLPVPNRSLVDYEKYNNYIGQAMVKNSIAIQCTRGCPYKCTYCHKIWPKSHIIRSAEHIYNEVKQYYDLGFRKFVIVDDIFNLNKKNSIQFFNLIIQNGLKVKLFFPNGMRGDILTTEYIDLMVKAGLAGLALALETASPRLQKLIQKNINIPKLKENIEYFCHKYPQVILELFTMHGFPTETEEEAMQTLEFIKSIKWLHFPYVHILKIFPNTDMADLAMENGISQQIINDSANLAFHQLPETIPFSKSFTLKYQSEYLNEYFLSKERLLHVLPHQLKVLTKDELVQKYDSYLPGNITSFDELLSYVGITEQELGNVQELNDTPIINLNENLKRLNKTVKPTKDALKVLLLDLSQFYEHDSKMLYDVCEPPLGLMYVMTYLQHKLGNKVNGKIAKSRIDFKNNDELRKLLKEFQPDIIGIRSLTYYKDFCHKTITAMRQWGVNTPIVLGGPYATSDYKTILKDKNVDAVVLGEGEVTFYELIKKVLENDKKFPKEKQLSEIKGLAYLPGESKQENAIIVLDELDTSQLSPASIPDRAQSDNLAYIIYTSGSTGNPKGVMVEHRNMVNLCYAQKNEFCITSDERILQFASINFDASVEQIGIALLSGAALVLVDNDTILDNQKFANYLSSKKVSHIHTVPIFLNGVQLEDTQYLKRVIAGGDICPPGLAKKWLGKCNFYNEYGPTETTVTSIQYKVNNALNNSDSLPIGRPVHNTQVYVLDKNLNIVPVGAKGELYIGGNGVTRGYLNRKELTEIHFIKNPFNYKEKLYKTGDVVRYLPDGNLEFAGRADNQVKIRGYRIELGEIEAALNRLKYIKECSVQVYEDENTNKRLIAYIVFGQEKLESQEVKDELKKYLPDYMIPVQYIVLEGLPLTNSGKIDKKSLPNPFNNPDTATNYVAPQTSVQLKLVEIWKEVLGVDTIGIHDNFFEHGGDSIISIQVVGRANRVGIHLTPKDLFKNQTIALLSENCTERENQILAEQGAIEGFVHLTPIQHQFFEKDFKNKDHWNQSILVDVDKSVPVKLLAQAFDIVLQHHDAFNLKYKKVENKWEQEHTKIKLNRIEQVDLQQLTASELKRTLELYIEETHKSLSITTGNLCKAVVFKNYDKKNTKLLIVIHHLAVDGVSWRIILEDLNKACKQLQNNQEVKLGAKTSSFKQWSERLQKFANSSLLSSEIPFWKKVAQTKVKNIDIDIAEGENTVESAKDITLKLTREQTALLIQSAGKAYKTEINDLLLTALTTSVCKQTGDTAIKIKLEGHGRETIAEDTDVSRTAGWFTTLYPVCLQKTENTLTGIIKSIKEQLRRIPNKGLGYGVLRYLHSDEELKELLKENEDNTISFNYLGQFDNAVNTGYFSNAKESPGQAIGTENARSSLIDVNAIVIDKELNITFTYSRNLHNRTTIERLVENYLNDLKEVITHCTLHGNCGFTPSDFPLCSISQKELEQIENIYTVQNIESIYPLSPTQEAMLYSAVNSNDPEMGVTQTMFDIKGDINIENFRKSWQGIIDKHTIFRTSIVHENLSNPLQLVHKELECDFEVIDFSTEPDVDTKLEKLAEDQRIKNRDLSQKNILKFKLVKISKKLFRFIWTHHHILIDGWTMPIVFNELYDNYEKLQNNISLSTETTDKFEDYINIIAAKEPEQEEQFWKEYLEGFTKPTTLPIENKNYKRNGSDIQIRVATEFTQKETGHIQSFSRKYRITINTIVQSAWSLVLSKYSNTADVVFGITVSGRPAELQNAENKAGLFINTLPLRINVDSGQNILEWLDRLQEQQVAVSEHLSTPYAAFKSILVYQNYPVEEELAEESKAFEIIHSQAFEKNSYPLTIMAGVQQVLKIRMSFNGAIYSSEDIKKLLEYFKEAINSIVNNPGKILRNIPLTGLNKYIENNKDRFTEDKTQRPFVEPEPGTEMKISEILSDLLNMERISTNESFFDLGINSLRLVQVVSRLRDKFEIEVPITQIAQTPTIQELAVYISAIQGSLKVTEEIQNIEEEDLVF